LSDRAIAANGQIDLVRLHFYQSKWEESQLIFNSRSNGVSIVPKEFELSRLSQMIASLRQS
jgi:hypothetical protein